MYTNDHYIVLFLVPCNVCAPLPVIMCDIVQLELSLNACYCPFFITTLTQFVCRDLIHTVKEYYIIIARQSLFRP